jgi:Tol biopolymer transport system component
MWGALAAAILLGSRSTAASPPSRIVFASSRTAVSQLYSEEPSGEGLAQLTFGTGGWGAPLPSPDGRFVAAFRGPQLWLMQGDGHGARLLAVEATTALSWSRDSRRLAFVSGQAIWTVAAASGLPRQVTHGHADGSPALSPDGRSIAFLRSVVGNVVLVLRRHGRERIVLKHVSGAPAWSPDGKWIAVTAGAGQSLELVRPSGGPRRVLVENCGYCAFPAPAWSPDSRRLAYADDRGVHVVRRSGRDRLLAVGATQGFAWSSRGKAIAFATTAGVGIVTLAGRVRTLVSFAPHEAQPGVGWSRGRTDLSYPTPEETPVLARVSPRELAARVPIRQLSADGDRVAYWLCPHVLGVWRPGDAQSLSLGVPSLAACRAPPETAHFGTYVFDLALAGNRLAYLTEWAGNEIHTALMLTTLEQGTEGDLVAEGAASRDFPLALGDAVGAGSTLVYGFRELQVTSPHPAPEQIWRIDGAKPVQITHGAEDLQPLSVDGSRIVARRPDGSLWLLGPDGGLLRTFVMSSLGAVLAGDDLVVLVQGELRDYSASTGELLEVWPLPDVPSSGRCRLFSCSGIRLTLDDAARGDIVYTLDGVVHLLRLSSGADATVPGATVAELTDSGLFYAYPGEEPWPGRIRFVPFDELPLR